MNDDQLLLASAYVDDDVDDAARARAEADPEVMAEIARLRDLRSTLREVGAPDAARRERAIGAALAAFADVADEPSTAAVTPAAVPRPRRASRSWWGPLAAAAALVVVVAAGVVALRGGGGQDGDDSAASATAAPAAAQEDATMAVSDSRADAALPAPQAADSETGSGGAPAATAASEATSAAGSDAQLAASLPVLTTPAELAAFATAAAGEAAAAPRAPADAAPSCTHRGTFVGTARYRDAVVEVFDDDGVVSALDATTCAVVEEVER